MKKLFVTMTICCASALAFGQDQSSKIIEVYGQEFFDQTSTTNPGAIELFSKYNLHGFDIVDSNPKYASEQSLSMVPLRSKTGDEVSVSDFLNDFNSSDFNMLEYGFYPNQTTQIFNLAGSNKVILIYSQKTILSK